MNWGDLAKTVIGMGAPVLGTALGGPLGGAAGKILADVLGVPADPAAVGAALTRSDEATIAVAQAEGKWADAAASIAMSSATQAETINTSIREEIATGVSWWHWRHLLGYVVLLWAVAPIAVIMRDLWVSNYVGIQNSIALAAALTPYFVGLCALLGYVASDTSKLRQAAVTGQPQPTILDRVGQVIGGLAKR